VTLGVRRKFLRGIHLKRNDYVEDITTTSRGNCSELAGTPEIA
jgi:hypothetical protein